MIIYIETKYKLEIKECFWSTSFYGGTLVKLYQIDLYDQISKKELRHIRVHQDELLEQINEILPHYYLQIRNEIKAKFNLN